MPVVKRVPTAAPSGTFFASGAFTDVDETVASPDGNFMRSGTNDQTAASATFSSFSNAIPDGATINSVTFRVRGRTQRPNGTDDTCTYRARLTVGSTTYDLTWIQSETTFGNKTATVSTGHTVAQLNAPTVVYTQTAFSQNMGPDALVYDLDAFEIEVDYTEAVGESLVRVVSEGLNLSAARAASLVLARGIAESLELSDARLASMSLTRATSESLSLPEVLVSVVALARSVSESLSLSESLAAVVGLIRAVSESLELPVGALYFVQQSELGNGSIDFSASGAFGSVTPVTFPVPSADGYTPSTLVAWTKRPQANTTNLVMGLLALRNAGADYIHLGIQSRSTDTDRWRSDLRASGTTRAAGGAAHSDAAWDWGILSLVSPTSRVLYSSGNTAGVSTTTESSPASLNEILVGLSGTGTNYDALATQFMLFTGTLTADQRTAVANGANGFEVEAVAGGTAVLVGYWPGIVITGGGNNYLRDVVGDNHILLTSAAVWSEESPPVTTVVVDPADLLRVVGESLGLGEVIVRVTSLVKAASESVEVAEGVSRLLSVVRVRAEDLEVVEGLVRSFGLSRVREEGVELSELTNRTAGIAKIVVEAFELLSAASRAFALMRTRNEVTEVSETVQASIAAELLRVIDEALSLDEAALHALAAEILRIVSEAVELTEQSYATEVLSRSLSESVEYAEVLAASRIIVAMLSEVLSVGETSAQTRSLVRTVTEALPVAEVAFAARVMIRLIGEVVEFAEDVDGFMDAPVTGPEVDPVIAIESSNIRIMVEL
jgi:hypothetical protein